MATTSPLRQKFAKYNTASSPAASLGKECSGTTRHRVCANRRVHQLIGWTLCAYTWLSLVSGPALAATLPAGFSESLVASGLQSPTAMEFAPDRRLFVCEQGGGLRVIKNGVLLPTPFVTVSVNASGERGLLGVAFDPAFAANRYVYVYYTARTPNIHNRVSRFTANGDVALAGSEVVILELEALSATNHNGGAIHFGADGKLYVAVGDNANGANSQSLENRLGKILRINPDGTIPSDNPFFTTATGVNRAIWALGLRNPFTFAVQPVSGTMFINDVGEISWEEINEGISGANYGWPFTEGYTNDPNFNSPLYAYDHSDGCAISGGTFYNPLIQPFPNEYGGTYFFADFCGGWIQRRAPGGAVADFASGISSPVDLKVSNEGSLYYLARGGGGATGVVYRIQYGVHPIDNVTANGTNGPLTLAPGDPLAIAFSFDAGSLAIVNPAEVYIGVVTQFGLFWFDPASQTFVLTPTRVYAGPLPSFGPATLINLQDASVLPSGPYVWFIFVDNDSNGVPNGALFDVVLTVVL